MDKTVKKIEATIQLQRYQSGKWQNVTQWSSKTERAGAYTGYCWRAEQVRVDSVTKKKTVVRTGVKLQLTHKGKTRTTIKWYK